MKRVIFTTYDDLKQPDTFQSNQIKDYYDRLVANKKDYADKIGVDFANYKNQMKDFEVPTIHEFAKVNLWKHHLMAELAKEYDEVMYVDMDVLFNTDLNVFEELDLSKGIHIKDEDHEIKNKINEEIILSNTGQRSATLKYHITKDLLGGKDCHVTNTGIMIGKSKHIKQIKFTKRLPDLIEKVNTIKVNSIDNGTATYLRMFYYPNNEALFSYILEAHDIPYVLMEDKWHKIINDKPTELNWNEIEVVHFVNKKFNTFFNDKTKCIYSIHIDIPDERLDNPVGPSEDPVNKSKRTKDRLAEYSKDLYENHTNYADAIGAEYIHFSRDDDYEEFFKGFPDLSEYDVINLYKVYLLDKLVKEYDLVLYVDFDVCFTNTIDVFNYMQGESLFCCDATNAFDSGVSINHPAYFASYNKDFRNPQAKYWNAHALLSEEDIDGDHDIFNTGIMMASKKVMEQIDYFSDIDEVINTMKDLKEDSMYPLNIQDSFGYDNETIMGYKVKKNNVPVYKLSETWHLKHDYNNVKSYDKTTIEYKQSKLKLQNTIHEHSSVMVHFISKNFGLVFDK